MTKRFTNHDDTIIDTTGEQLISTDEIVDKMNELHEENQKKDKVITHLMRIIHSNEPYVFAKAVEKNVKEMLK